MSAHNESIATEVIAASIGGAVSASVLYPLEVLKTKMQSETKTTASSGTTTKTTKIPSGGGTAKRKEKEEEDGKDFGGSAKTATEEDDEEEEALNKAAAATKPPPTTPPQQPPPPKSSHTMISYAQSMYRTNGISCFYSGIETSAIQSATEKGLYFLAYTALKNMYHGVMGSGGDIGTLPNLVLGCMAEWAHLPITLPIDCLTTKIQTDTSGKGAFALMSSMLSEKGIGGMYKGIQAYTILCLKPAIQYTVFEQVKRIVLSSRRQQQQQNRQNSSRNHRKATNNNETLSAMEAFLLGMIARTIATIVVFPYLRAKVMLQSTASSSASNKPKGIPGMLKELYNEGGINELFRGLGPELTRGVLSAALMLMIKEKIGIWVKEQFVSSSNKRR